MEAITKFWNPRSTLATLLHAIVGSNCIVVFLLSNPASFPSSIYKLDVKLMSYLRIVRNLHLL